MISRREAPVSPLVRRIPTGTAQWHPNTGPVTWEKCIVGFEMGAGNDRRWGESTGLVWYILVLVQR